MSSLRQVSGQSISPPEVRPSSRNLSNFRLTSPSLRERESERGRKRETEREKEGGRLASTVSPSPSYRAQVAGLRGWWRPFRLSFSVRTTSPPCKRWQMRRMGFRLAHPAHQPVKTLDVRRAGAIVASERNEEKGAVLGVAEAFYKEKGLARIKLVSFPQMEPSLSPK